MFRPLTVRAMQGAGVNALVCILYIYVCSLIQREIGEKCSPALHRQLILFNSLTSRAIFALN